jgi:hypothetical protein
MSEVSYTYDEESARGADKLADRATTSGAYVGTITKAFAVTSSEKGSKGIQFDTDAPGQGTATFTLWTHDANGDKLGGQGPNFINALMFFFGLKGLKTEKGTAEIWVDGAGGKRELKEAEVTVFPELCNKKIGYVLQKDVGDNGFRFNLYGLFDPVTRRTMSEVKDNVTKPVKLDRLVAGLKDKVKKTGRRDEAEPAQPSTGVDAGD